MNQVWPVMMLALAVFAAWTESSGWVIVACVCISWFSWFCVIAMQMSARDEAIKGAKVALIAVAQLEAGMDGADVLQLVYPEEDN